MQRGRPAASARGRTTTRTSAARSPRAIIFRTFGLVEKVADAFYVGERGGVQPRRFPASHPLPTPRARGSDLAGLRKICFLPPFFRFSSSSDALSRARIRRNPESETRIRNSTRQRVENYCNEKQNAGTVISRSGFIGCSSPDEGGDFPVCASRDGPIFTDLSRHACR